MKNLFEKNISAIGGYMINVQNKRKLWEKTIAKSTSVYKKEKQLYRKRDNWEYRLNSIDSENEVRFITRNIDYKKDNLLLVFGMSQYELVENLAKETTVNSRIVLFEPDIEVLAYCLQYYNYESIFASGKIVFIDSDDFENQVMKELQILMALDWENLVYNMQVILNPNYYCYKNFVLQCVKFIKETFDAKIKYLGNSLEDSFMGLRNVYKNVGECMRCGTMDDIRDKFKGVPGIIVSAGPSLDKNIRYLKEAKGKALVFACDASVRACEQVGVVPDVVASVERVKETYQFYYEGRNFDENTILVAPTVVWPDILSEYAGKKIVVSKMDRGYDKWFNENLENLKCENIGMSAATVAFKTAAVAGCNPIIFIGQDLAFTDDKIHSDSTHTKFEGENGLKTFDGSFVEGIDGELVKTNDIYNWFRSWFEAMIISYSDRKVIDATEGGAKIKGTEIACLKDVVEQYCTEEVGSFSSYVTQKDITKEDEAKKYGELFEKVNEEISMLHEIKEKAEAHYATLEEIYDKNIEKMNEKQLIKSVRKMEKGNEIIQFINSNMSLNSYFEQIIKQTVTHVKLIGNELTGETVLKNLKLQGNLMGMIMRSCVLIIDEYEKMSEYYCIKVQEMDVYDK